MNEFEHLDQSMAIQLLLAGKAILQKLDERLEVENLSAAKLWALHTLAVNREQPTITCLAENMNTTKSNVTAMVDRLIADGLVTRERNPEDRRTVLIELTAEGWERYKRAAAAALEVNVELRALYSTEAAEIFHECLGRFLAQA